MREPALYGVADVACILYSLGDGLDTRPTGVARALVVFQDSASRASSWTGPASLSTAHNTGFAVGAMNLFQPDLRNGELPKCRCGSVR